MEIGKKIKELRKEKNLTQKQLALMSGVAEITIRQYEADKRQPRTEQLCRISDALEIPLEQILKDDRVTQYKRLDAYRISYENQQNHEDKKEEILLDIFQKLNKEGQNHAIEMIESLVYNPKYIIK